MGSAASAAQPFRQGWSFTGGALRQRAAKFTWKRLHVNLRFDKYYFTMSSNLKVCLQITKLDSVALSNMNLEKETQCCSPPSCCYACFGRHIKANCSLPAYNRPLIHLEHSLTWQCHCKVLQIPNFYFLPAFLGFHNVSKLTS